MIGGALYKPKVDLCGSADSWCEELSPQSPEAAEQVGVGLGAVDRGREVEAEIEMGKLCGHGGDAQMVEVDVPQGGGRKCAACRRSEGGGVGVTARWRRAGNVSMVSMALRVKVG